MELCDHTGLVLEGGGFRAIFVAAVLEAMHNHHLFFPYAIGVSAGAAYGVSYVTRQKGRNLQTNSYINHPQYCGMRHLLKNSDYFNWEFMYKTIPTQIIPLDYQALGESSTRMQMVMTNCLTARAEYFDANTLSPDVMRDLLTATSSLPYVAKMKMINDIPYLDGGLTDAIPVHHALAEGNSRVVVVLTRPKGYRKMPSKDKWLLRILYRDYPDLVKALDIRVEKYNQTLHAIENMEASGQAFVIRPFEAIPVGRLENNPQVLENVYLSVLSTMELVMRDLTRWLQSPVSIK